jgi:hypothetical protein
MQCSSALPVFTICVVLMLLYCCTSLGFNVWLPTMYDFHSIQFKNQYEFGKEKKEKKTRPPETSVAHVHAVTPSPSTHLVSWSKSTFLEFLLFNPSDKIWLMFKNCWTSLACTFITCGGWKGARKTVIVIGASIGWRQRVHGFVIPHHFFNCTWIITRKTYSHQFDRHLTSCFIQWLPNNIGPWQWNLRYD